MRHWDLIRFHYLTGEAPSPGSQQVPLNPRALWRNVFWAAQQLCQVLSSWDMIGMPTFCHHLHRQISLLNTRTKTACPWNWRPCSLREQNATSLCLTNAPSFQLSLENHRIVLDGSVAVCSDPGSTQRQLPGGRYTGGGMSICLSLAGAPAHIWQC